MGSLNKWIDAADTIVAEAFRLNLDPRLIVAVTSAESQFATHYIRSSHNPFGMLDVSGRVHAYTSNEAAIRSIAITLDRHVHLHGQKTIADLYSGKGTSPMAGHTITGFSYSIAPIVR